MKEIGVAIHCQCGILYPVCVGGSEKHISRCLSCEQVFPRIVVKWLDVSQGILSISLNGQNREEVVFSGKVEHLSLDHYCGNPANTQERTCILFRPDFQGIDKYIEQIRIKESHLPVFR